MREMITSTMHSSHQTADRQDSSEESHVISLTAQLVERGSSAQEGTSVGSVGLHMLSIPLEVLTSAVKISSQAKERKTDTD